MPSLQHLDLRDIPVAVRTNLIENDKQQVVLVHGLGEDSSTWAHQQNYWGRTTHAVDVRGHGATPVGEADGTLDQLADDLLAVLEQVGPSICVGFSMGGAIVLAAAARQTESLVTHAVGVCTSSVVGGRVAERFRSRAAGISAEGAEFARQALQENLTANVPEPPADFHTHLADRLAAIGDGSGFANGSLAMASMNEVPLTPRLSAVSCPVDIFVGANDASCPPRAAEIIVEAAPHGHWHLLPGVGHFVNIENPGLLTRALENLLG